VDLPRAPTIKSFKPSGVEQNTAETGKSYVIFGKTDTNAINLSQLNGDLKYAIDHLGVSESHILTINDKPPCATGNSR
jgi:hypothetical protein